MARVAFTLGYQEKHKVVVNVSFWTWNTGVWIDGRKVTDKEFRTLGFTSPDGGNPPNVTLAVGESERHQMGITYSRAFPLTGFSIQIDGRDVYQWKPFKPKTQPYGFGISDYPAPSTAP